MSLPSSQACENNKAPIVTVLKDAFAECQRVLEVGSGTGQHAVHFAAHLPHLIWHTSDLAHNHPGINGWIDEQPQTNLVRPVVFDLDAPDWPGNFDGVFSANTAHIVSWPQVETLFAQVGEHLPADGVFALYGPFRYDGAYTSDSNRQFDAMLRERDPASGIRDLSDLKALGRKQGLHLTHDHDLPANNRLLIWHKVGDE